MSKIFEGPVVCNCGPIIGLGRIDLATLPFDLFPSVHIPEEVAGELLGSDSPDAGTMRAALERAEVLPAQVSIDPLLASELDPGEAAVIAAAIKPGLRGVILDERKARRIAATVYGLDVKGSAGLLIEAKRRGLIEAVRPCLEGMIAGGYFISDRVVDACLAAADEL